MEEYTTEEKQKIVQLRQKITSDIELKEEFSTDHFLVKWLRARNMDLNKAEEMLRTSLQWRKDNKVDTILETTIIPEKFRKNAPIAYLGPDPVTGCPVLLYLMGRDDLKTKLEEVGAENMLRYNIYFMEYIHKNIMKDCSEKAGRPITQLLELVDLTGYSYRQMMDSQCREFVVRMQNMFDANYPEFLNHVAMVNAPKLFYVLYNILKPFVAKATLDKIAIYGPHNWQEEARKRFPMELFPVHWGGKREGVDEYCSGDPIWMLGLDKDFFKDLDMIKVKPRDRVHLHYEVLEEGASISWKFKSESHDICFGILHEEIEVLPLKRVDSHKEIQIGELECRRIGKYTIVFDNSYSYTKGKNVHHRIEVVSPYSSIEIMETS